MEDSLKICHIKNMNKFNFNSTINISVDTNANVKTILDINSFLYDIKTDCGDGKAIVSGKIGVKVLYIDTDNITNTLSDSQNFSETIMDSSISKDSYLKLNNPTISNTLLSTENNIKINFEINMAPTSYINLPIKNNVNPNESLITKKREIVTNTITNYINTKFEYISNLEIKDNINKILSHNCYFNPYKTVANDGFITVEGKLTNTILYESIIENDVVLKEAHDQCNLKYDIEITNISTDENLDLSFAIDNSLNDIVTERDENENNLTIKNSINVHGVGLKQIEIELIDDVFSTSNILETNTTTRDFNKIGNCFSISEVISNEISLLDSEPAIDEVIANLNINPEITNCYIKNNKIFFEGVATSNLTYIDENKEYKNKVVEIPFIIDSKIEAESLHCEHHNISILDSKIKIKRGTIIEMEYSLHISMCQYETCSCEMVDSFSIGKPIDHSKYDFQIFIAKQGETLWELCKRIKISPEEIKTLNQNLPLIMEGGERVVVKR